MAPMRILPALAALLLTWLLLGCLLLGCLTVSATGQMMIKKSDGTRVEGKIVEDGKTFIRVSQPDGKTISLTYAQLHPQTIYELRNRRTPKDNGGEQLKLGNYALTNDMFQAARTHYFNALVAGKEFEPKARSGMKRTHNIEANYLLEKAREMQRTGNFRLETVLLSRLVTAFAGTKAAERAEDALKNMKMGDQARDALDLLDKRAKKEVTEAKEKFSRAIEANRKGLELSRKRSKAEAQFRRALKLFRECRGIVASVRKQYGANKEIADRCKESDEALDRHVVDVVVNIAQMYTARENYKTALDWINKALAEHPKNARLLSNRSNIELSMNWSDRGAGRR